MKSSENYYLANSSNEVSVGFLRDVRPLALSPIQYRQHPIHYGCTVISDNGMLSSYPGSSIPVIIGKDLVRSDSQNLIKSLWEILEEIKHE